MKLSKLYRDIVSALNAPEDQIRLLDVTNLINQTISDIRVEFIKNGLGHEFLYTETIWATVKDVIEYPFLYTAELDKTLMRGLPIQWTVQQSNFWVVEDELEDNVDSWSEGDLAIKDGYVYEALEDIASVNTYDETFEVDNIRNYYIDNGFTYYEDDVVYYETDDTYWKCTSEYVNDKGESPSASGLFDKLYWKRVDYAYNQGTPVPFSELHQNRLFDSIDNHYPFSIKEKDFYTTTSSVPITLSYIPEWEYIEDFDSELGIPDMIVQPVRNRCIQLIGSKLGIKAENLPKPESE